MRPWLAVAALGCGMLAAAGEVYAQSDLFYWIDGKGNVHVTDRLGDVPEPYYSMYAARLREEQERRAAEQRREQPRPPPAAPVVRPAAPPVTASIVEQELARQQSWRALVAKWRGELEAATAQVRRLQAEIDSLQLNNPTLRYTPQVGGRLRDLEQQLVKARQRVEQARQMLLEELPRRARQDNVPPRWLE